ncbi:hypothetical protein HPB50_010946 [Hyalomma asiaticum]|uniref:Uncharacterized protein n=1 Tax=Hyalomma asiaticum TaxID=266040 RepID=A0ACB7SUE8_HYAAI|nr:hypothetical protein HPB50_010946 [Hyalomma asiaticum]
MAVRPTLTQSIMASDNRGLVIWQWNCRGLKHKKAVLQQYIRHTIHKPDILILQETLSKEITLPGYQSFSNHAGGRGLHTLVKKQLTTIEHDTHLAQTEHTLIEIIPTKKRRTSLFILKVYSSLSKQRQRFRAILHKATKIAGSNTLIVGGDFNVPEKQWGYGYSSFKGRQLAQDALDLNLTLITDPTNPTRTGNSTTRDTTPDLTFVSNSRPGSITWRNTSTDLGSDHMIIEITVATDDIQQGNSRTFIWTDWEAFRKTRDTQQQTTADKITDIDSWTRTLRNDIKTSTKAIVTNIETPQMDSRLAHLIEAKNSILARWKKQRLSRKLRKKIADINRNIEEHCHTLSRQQWNELCNEVDGQLHNGKSCQLLKHLLDEAKTKSHQRDCLARLLHKEKEKCGIKTIIDQLQSKYLPSTLAVQHGPYEGNVYGSARFLNGKRLSNGEGPFDDVW